MWVKNVAPLKLSALFSFRLSIFVWSFVSLLPFYIHTYLQIVVSYLNIEQNGVNFSRSTYRFYRAACNADAVLWWDFCLSVRRVICDKMEERSVQIFILYERTFSLVFWEEEWLVGGRPLLPEILGQLARVGEKSLIGNRIRAFDWYRPQWPWTL